MFDIKQDTDGTVLLFGRLDAISAPLAREFLDGIGGSCRLDFSNLDYIASVGLGLLASAQRRLMDEDQGLCLCGLSPHLREVFALAGFEGIFDFE
jgi:anti-anti-sigma factor